MTRELETLVRRVDEDRWRAAALAPPETRAALVAIYAVNYEIAKTAETVHEPQLGLIRLAWWRETIEEIAAGKEVRAHPAAQALAAAHARRALPLGAFDAMAAAREAEFAPFAGWPALADYVDATAGGVLGLALAACGGASADFVRVGGRVWGYCGLARAMQQGARAFHPPAAEAAELQASANRAYADARRLAKSLGSPLFPAVAYLALVPGYLGALARGRSAPSGLARQLRLIAAAATGGI